MSIDFLVIRQWLEAHSDDIIVNLLAGVIAAVLILMTQTTVIIISTTIHDLITRRFRIRRIAGFRLGGDAPIEVLSGSLEEESPVLQGPDARAAARIQVMLEQVFRGRRVVDGYRARQSDEEIPQSDFCTVGGPEFNSCTRSVIAYLSSVAAFDSEGNLVLPSIGRVYKPEMEGGRIKKDYGLLVRMRNPVDGRRTCVVVAGCDTYGVYAAAQLLTNSARFPHLAGQFRKKRGLVSSALNKDFVAVISCRAQGTDVSNVRVEYVTSI